MQPSRTPDRIAYAGLLILAAASPFELRQPLFRLAGLEVTNLELILLCVLAAGAACLLWSRKPLHWRTPLTAPAAGLLGLMILSSLWAAEDPGQAWRFTGRFAAGLCVLLLACNTLGSPLRRRGLLAAVALPGAFVSGLAFLEYLGVAGIDDLLSPFRPGPFWVGSVRRAGSTLQYPTITSMWLEIAFGMCLGLLLDRPARNGKRLSVLLFAVSLLTASGVIVTLTRGGLLALAAQLTVVCMLAFKRQRRALPVLAALAVLIAAFFTALTLASPDYRLRLQSETSRQWYRFSIQAPARLSMAPGEQRRIPVTVSNRGELLWEPEGASYPFRLSYHWMDAQRDVVLLFEGMRTPLSAPVPAGQSTPLDAYVQAPPRPGSYRLAWDMVQENLLWFSSEEDLTTFTEVVVQGQPVAGPPFRETSLPSSQSRHQIGRSALWRAALSMTVDHPLLGVGPDHFRLVYGRYLRLDPVNRSLHANNMYLEFFADLGLAGGILFLWLWLRSALTLASAVTKGTVPELSALAAACCTLTAIAVHGLVDHFWGFTPTYVLMWISLGLAVRVSESD